MIIDAHSHILPGVDDGSHSIEITVKMLQIMYQQHVDCVVATPHFYPEKMGMSAFLQKRDDARKQIEELDLTNVPHIEYGAEVSFFREIGNCDDLDVLCIGHTNLILLEMPFRTWNQQDLRTLEKVLDNGLVPVLAHLERFYPLQKDLGAFNDAMEFPIYSQINAEALLSYKTRGMALKMLSNGYAHLLGSDCHDMHRRRPNLHDGRKVIEKRLGSIYLNKMDELGARLISTL